MLGEGRKRKKGEKKERKGYIYILVVLYFYNVILKFCPYLNIGCRGILELKKKNPVQTREAP